MADQTKNNPYKVLKAAGAIQSSSSLDTEGDVQSSEQCNIGNLVSPKETLESGTTVLWTAAGQIGNRPLGLCIFDEISIAYEIC